jgi:hypothetical protein
MMKGRPARRRDVRRATAGTLRVGRELTAANYRFAVLESIRLSISC